MAEKQTFSKVIQIGTSKKGDPYFFIRTNAGRLVFINLIAAFDNKLIKPNKYQHLVNDGVKALEVKYSSYIKDYHNDNLTLFNVTVVDELYNL